MSRIEEAARRLEVAVGRLERAVERAAEADDDSGATRRLAEALAAARADYAELEQTTGHVASRLDQTIARLNAALGA